MRNRFLKAFLPLLLIPLLSLNSGWTMRGETKVWIVESTSSKCYHLDKDCRTLKVAKHPIKCITLQEAKNMGKRACKVCSR